MPVTSKQALPLFLVVWLQRLGARAISQSVKKASAAFSPARLMPVAPEQALPLFLVVDNFSTYFLLSTHDIDSFYTNMQLVDNYYSQNVTVVDKLRKSIAHKAIICYYICVFTLNNFITDIRYPQIVDNMWIVYPDVL